uniref:Uncharacterized protein n=1 Tax=Anguilla anguilla TaxID=7936 RepID=A0A0E9Q5L5_ANGAN
MRRASMMSSTRISPPAMGTAITAARNHTSLADASSCMRVMRFLPFSGGYLPPWSEESPLLCARSCRPR